MTVPNLESESDSDSPMAKGKQPVKPTQTVCKAFNQGSFESGDVPLEVIGIKNTNDGIMV